MSGTEAAVKHLLSWFHVILSLSCSILSAVHVLKGAASVSNVDKGSRKIALKKSIWGFPGGAVVENLPANAGDTGSSPGLGRSHMPQNT